MSNEESVYTVCLCLNCQILNNSTNEFCFKCGVLLLSEELLCSECNNLTKEGDKKCYVCGYSIKEEEPDIIKIEDFYMEEKNQFIDIIYEKKSREHIMNKYGEKGFDTFTGFIDWEFLSLFEIVEEELKYLPTARYILSEDASEILLSKYGLIKKYDFEEKVKKIAENLNEKIKTGDLLQPLPEVRISFSVAAEVYKKYFSFEHRIFEKVNQEDLARILFRALVNFYSTLLQNPYVKDEENISDRKLILLSTILFDITFCIELGDSLSNRQYYECENIINERLMRSALLYKFYRMKKEQRADKTKIRNLCREIITDLGGALYLQWRVKGKDVKQIFELYGKKLFEFVEGGIDLPYFEILESFLSNMYYMYEGVGPFPWGESKEAIPYLIKTIDILNRLEEKEEERRERIGAYIRAYDFYRNNIEYVALEMMRDEKSTKIMFEFFVKYYEINSKIDKEKGITNEIEEIISFVDSEKEKETMLKLVKSIVAD